MAGENREYVLWIRGLRCVGCGASGPSDPHHMPRKHGGVRMHDFTCIPMCRRCHDDAQHPRSLKGRFDGWDEERYRFWHSQRASDLLGRFTDLKRERNKNLKDVF